jgi:transcriptional regulator with XRE-family HTH domain
MLANNLKYLRRQRKETQEHVADALEINRTTYADYERGKTEPIASLLLKIARYFDVNPTDLLTIDLGVPLFHQRNSEPPNIYVDGLRVVAVTVNDNRKENIELVPVNAVAGYAIGFSNPEFIQDLPRFNLPGLSDGTYRAFEIQGKSMPPIHQGFIVVGRYVDQWQDLKNGKRYILVLKNEGVVFKRVINEIGQNRKLVLFSDNPEFLPFTVSVTDVFEAWEMVAYLGFPDDPSNTSEAIFDKLQAIEQKLSILTYNNH